jgi:hypothetical protein
MRMAQSTIGQWHRKKHDCLFEKLPDGTFRERSITKAFAIERDLHLQNGTTPDRQTALSLFYVNVTPPVFILLWAWLLWWAWERWPS